MVCKNSFSRDKENGFFIQVLAETGDIIIACNACNEDVPMNTEAIDTTQLCNMINTKENAYLRNLANRN